MRYWSYNEPTFTEDGDVIGNEVVTKSEDQIVKEFYGYWFDRMVAKYGEEYFKEHFCREDCIMDWVVINWAWEVE